MPKKIKKQTKKAVANRTRYTPQPVTYKPPELTVEQKELLKKFYRTPCSLNCNQQCGKPFIVTSAETVHQISENSARQNEGYSTVVHGLVSPPSNPTFEDPTSAENINLSVSIRNDATDNIQPHVTGKDQPPQSENQPSCSEIVNSNILIQNHVPNTNIQPYATDFNKQPTRSEEQQVQPSCLEVVNSNIVIPNDAPDMNIRPHATEFTNQPEPNDEQQEQPSCSENANTKVIIQNEISEKNTQQYETSITNQPSCSGNINTSILIQNEVSKKDTGPKASECPNQLTPKEKEENCTAEKECASSVIDDHPAGDERSRNKFVQGMSGETNQDLKYMPISAQEDSLIVDEEVIEENFYPASDDYALVKPNSPEKVENYLISTPCASNYSRTVSKKSRHVQVNIGGCDLSTALLENAKAKFSKDKKEEIRKKIKNNTLLYSAEFIQKFSHLGSEGKVVVKIHGSDNLLTADMGEFVAIIELLSGVELDFNKSFEKNKEKLYDRLTISKVLQDTLLERRNKMSGVFKNILFDRINKIEDYRDCAEDVLQLSLISDQTSLKTDTSILQEITKNKYISSVVKRASQLFLEAESELKCRNKVLPKFKHSVSPVKNDLLKQLKDISNEGLRKHKDNLIKKCSSNNFQLLCHLLNIKWLPEKTLLYLSSNDIKLFSDIYAVSTRGHLDGEVIDPKFFFDLWQNFYEKVKKIKKPESLDELGSLINPVYIFLFKSFQELMLEISAMTKISTKDLFLTDGNQFGLPEHINWPNISPINGALEQQYRLIFKLMNHFKPGEHSNKKKFTYTYKLKDCGDKSYWQKFLNFIQNSTSKNLASIPEEHLVWLFILDCGLGNIETSDEHFHNLSHSLFKGFAKFIQESQHDRYESFRIAAHNITKFAAKIYPYISAIDSDSMDFDNIILDKQIEFISDMLILKDDLVFDNFASLINVYNEYWKNRSSVVGKIVEKCPSRFQEEIKNSVFLKLLKIVDTALSKKVTVQTVIYYFRLYNEFLEHFKSLNFDWLVSETSLEELNQSPFPFCKFIAGTKSYQVSNHEAFIEIFDSKGKEIPKHYLIEVVKDLLDTVIISLFKENWSNSQQVKAASDLLLAIGHSFIHFKKQANETDFEKFREECTLPFRNVIVNSETSEEFETRLSSVEDFYHYTRKQNEIGIADAVKKCVEDSQVVNRIGFRSEIDSDILKAAYKKYLDKFIYLVNLDIQTIVANMRKELENIPKMDEWTPELKQNTIPSLLAYLASVWTILKSKDVESTGRKITPHCVQILCIFRLLGIDAQSNGVDKHLAQVLTGQGKSIILGLLSALLAITGHTVRVICYIQYLASRDENAFSEFFKILRVARNVKYSTIDSLANDVISFKINGRTENLRTLVTKLIFDKVPYFTFNTEESNNTVLIVDEVDVFFTNLFYSNTYDPCATVGMAALLEIQPKLWDIVEEGVHDKESVLEKIKKFIHELLKDAKNEDFKKFMETTEFFFQKELEKMVTTAINVSKAKENMNMWYIYKFKIDNDGFISFRDSSGYYRTNVFEHYYNMFNYFRLKKKDFDHKYYSNYGYLHVNCGHISFSNLPKGYSEILGVSGTLTTLNEYEKAAVKSYGINKMSLLPSFFGKRNLKFTPSSDFVIEDTEDGWLETIFDHVSKIIGKGRAVIAFFDTEKEIELFSQKFRSRINRFHILTGNEETATLQEYINEAGVAETLTAATRNMARGVDFKSNDLKVEELGGTHVIQTHLSLDIKDELQHQGRTAREDNQGSYELIVCREHLEALGCSETSDGISVSNYQQLCEVRETKAILECADANEKKEKSEEKHNLTMDLLKSFSEFSPDKREECFSKLLRMEV